MTRTSNPEAPAAARRIIRPEHRQRLGRIMALWGSLVLGSIALLTALVIWHLTRRAHLIRQRLGPPRGVRLPDLDLPLKTPEAKPRDFGNDPP